MQKEKKLPDWERIEADYRAGLMSLREIASPHGVTEGAIRKRAKRDGWERNLAAQINAKAEELVRREAVREEVRKNGGSVPESDIVDVNAKAHASVLLEHRKDARELREKASKYRNELDSCGDELSKRANILKTLTEIEKQVVAIERQALGLEDGAPAQDAGGVITRIERVIIRV